MTDTNEHVYEPAVLVKAGEPLVPPHQHRFHLPNEGHWDQRELDNGKVETFWDASGLTNGDVYRCTCGKFFKYSERGMSYMYMYDTAEGTSHWYRCDENGNPYKWTDVAPWWKKMFGVRDMRYVLDES